MANYKFLSFTNVFNQQKIIINDSETVSVPVSGLTPDTVLTIPTNQEVRPTARVFIEIGGLLGPAYQSTSATFNSLGKFIAFYPSFDSSNNLVIQTYSFEGGATNVTIHYRIYKDGRPQ